MVTWTHRAQGWVLTEANGINDYGWIVGQGLINGEYHAFLAIPNQVRNNPFFILH
jgi:hypothetical protein